jgi:TDG/mug DNA glycosylase family protein
MDKDTVAIYEARAAEWKARRPASRTERARAFAARVPVGAVRADLGSGHGNYTADLGAPVVALDAARAMLEMVPDAAPGAWRVQADLEHPPFADRSLGAAWASMSYLHVSRPRLPLALARLHWALVAGAPVHIDVIEGDDDLGPLPRHDDFEGRRFAQWTEQGLRDTVVGAGLSVDALDRDGDSMYLSCTRLMTLPDTVAPGMRLLVCGLNPSIYSAERGVGYARPGNRFWPAALAAGLVTRAHDPLHALVAHGIGMTDLVKRPTVAADELTPDEYGDGVARVERLVGWLQPAAVCFVGLAGWRAAVDRKANVGPVAGGFAGVPAYLMPSTSGLNTHARLDDLTAHLRAALAAGLS